VHGVDQTPEGLGAAGVYRDGVACFESGAFLTGVCGGFGVGVDDLEYSPYFVSMAARMAVTEAPELKSKIASRPTSMQIWQPIPWGSHWVTMPFAARDFTKQS
jgi:hypothetical protein